MPLLLSPLPLNIDGFPLARIATGILEDGRWLLDPADLHAYNLRMPAYSAVWSALAGLAGLHPLTDLPWAMALVTSLVVLPGYLLGVKSTGHRGVGLAAGAFLALFGSFLFLTSAIMKESLGLVILPIVVLLFAERADPRKRALALVLLLVIPFLHHLTTLMALGMVSALVVLSASRAVRRGTFRWRSLVLDVLTGPGAAAATWAYYSAVDMPFFRDVTSAGDLALFLSLTGLLAYLLARLRRPAALRARPRARRLPGPVAIVPAAVLLVLLANDRVPVFAGTGGTRPAFLALLPALAILAAFAVAGYPVVRRTMGRAEDLVLAMLVAPAALVLFALLRGLDPLSHALVYRSFDYIDFAFALLAGVGVVLAWNAVPRMRCLRLAVPALFLAALLATTPMAWESQAVFGVENVTTSAEFEALAYLATLGAANVTTDQRLADVAAWWFGIDGDATLPFRLSEGEDVPGPGHALLLERWTTVGAQVHPAANLAIPRAVLDAFLSEHTVLRVTGPPGDRIFLVYMGAVSG